MIYEVFDTRTAVTFRHVEGKAAAAQFAETMPYSDYSEAPQGFYIKVQSGDRHTINPAYFANRREAQRHCDMSNMASDTATYSVIRQD